MVPPPPAHPRPVIDPDVDEADRALLAATPQALTPATRPPPRPAPRPPSPPRPLLWAGALLAALALIRVPGLAPAAVTLLLTLAVALPVALASRSGRSEPPAAAAARRHHGRYLLAEDFDAPARALLVRAQTAVDTVTATPLAATGHIDPIDNDILLPRQLWEIATALRRITDLRDRARLQAPDRLGIDVDALIAQSRAALEAAQESVTTRVAALERYASFVTAAQEHHQRLHDLHRLLDEQQDYRDLLAATAADEHAVAHISELTDRARLAEADLERALQAALEQARLLAPGDDPGEDPDT
ncbi:MAG: hypothetical protein M0026_09055 [Nocardiopsaceae bacterium]|nr:hypothetical protein [Nocardiopsaceae bacterium]